MQCDSQSTDPLKIAVSEQVAVSAHAQIEAQQDGKTFGFRQTKMPQQFSGADTNKDGTVSSRIEGRPIQGEDDTKRAGQMLAQAMSTANEQWELTDGPATGAVDCVLKDSSNPPRRREVQVVRAIADCKLYQQLAAGNEVIDVNRNPEDVAQWLFDAVTKKAELPEKVRSGLILALDAQRTSVCALYLVIETYRRHFGAQTRSPNFEQVWIVGPTVSMTHRLDM